MSERVANPLVRPNMSKNTPNVWQLAGMIIEIYCNDRIRWSAVAADDPQGFPWHVEIGSEA